MENTYERLVDLLGKSHEGEVFRKFVDDLAEQADFYQSGPYLCAYNFTRSGFHLMVEEAMVSELSAVLRSSSVEGIGSFTALPTGLTKDDKRSDVRNKLGISPAGSGTNRKSGELIDHYKLDPIVISFWFDRESELLTQVRMRLVK